MTTPVWCELVCDDCAGTSPGQWTYKHVPRRELVRLARAAGWYIRTDTVLCKRCVRLKRDNG